jgi:hypothetical protein
MTKLKIRITFTEELLGTASANPDLHREFIASNAPDAQSLEEEVESIGVEGVIEKSMTVFSRSPNKEPVLWNYQIKGFFKDACSMLSRVGGIKKKEKDKKEKEASYKSRDLTAYKKIIDGLVFVLPRQIKINFPEGTSIQNCQRPIRVSTAKGERVALANSETAPAGSFIDVEIRCLDDNHVDLVREWLDYGILRGLGQWRNSGKGSFSWKEIK